MTVFLDEISIWIDRHTGMPCPVVDGHHPTCLRAYMEQKVEEGHIYFFFPAPLRWDISSSALEVEFISLAPLVLRPLGSDWITPPQFSGLQFTESRSRDSSGPGSSVSLENLDCYRFWYWEWDVAITNNLKSGNDFATGLLEAAGRV